MVIGRLSTVIRIIGIVNAEVCMIRILLNHTICIGHGKFLFNIPLFYKIIFVEVTLANG